MTANITGIRSSESARSTLLSQVLRFGLVGVACATVDYTSLVVAVALGVWADVARGLSFALGSTVAYLLNRRYTFNSRRDALEAASVAAAYAVTFVIIMAVNAVARRVLPDSSWQITLAWMLSQSVGTTFNFLTQRTLIFSR